MFQRYDILWWYDMSQWYDMLWRYDMVCNKMCPDIPSNIRKWMDIILCHDELQYAMKCHNIIWHTLGHNIYDMQWNVWDKEICYDMQWNVWDKEIYDVPPQPRYVLKVMLWMKWNWKVLSCMICVP